jgi:putative peptidoglycan lipid II flippase
MNRLRHPLIGGAAITGLGTLASRLLGMVRDMATAAVLGMSAGGVMDAFVVAFRVPNLLRRLFGEGALAASYLPVLSAHLERDRQAAWQLASVTLTWVSMLLIAIVAAAEAACWIAWHEWGRLAEVRLLVGLTVVMLPYVIFVCLAAQLAATLHALGHFAVPALVPTLLNLSWLFGLWVVAPYFSPDKQAQVYVLAGAVLFAGPLQVLVQLFALRRLGFRYQYDWPGAKDGLRTIAVAMGPTLVGLTITQINTMADSLIGWGLATGPNGPEHIEWLPGATRYPMRHGAAAAIYYGERLYQFPLGILGVAVATAIFPLLSRHAARGDREKLAEDLTLGLRLVVFLAVPASVGLIVLAEPLARLLFQRGEFTAEDSIRTARMIAWYSVGVWAYCALPVVVRGYYALNDRLTPVKVGLVAVALNLGLDLLLIWPLAEAGLAVATASSACLQLILLVAVFSRGQVSLGWSALGSTILRTVPATCSMGLAAYGVLAMIQPTASLGNQLARVLVPFATAVAVYFAVYLVVGGREARALLGGVDFSRGKGQGPFADDTNE